MKLKRINIPVILISGYTFDEQEIDKFTSSKVVRLNKPFDAKILIDKINSFKKAI